MLRRAPRASALSYGSLTEGIEKQTPRGRRRDSRARQAQTPRSGQFEGYTIIGSLAGARGSGGQACMLPSPIPSSMLAAFARSGTAVTWDQVVIKSFSLSGRRLEPPADRARESIARCRQEARASCSTTNSTIERFYLRHAIRAGRVALASSRSACTPTSGSEGTRAIAAARRGHAATPTELLTHAPRNTTRVRPLAQGRQARQHHRGRPRARPPGRLRAASRSLRSSMTLTTHGTEYFRDPEMVRMALKGVKVHQVNGAKFDVYAAGAVLYLDDRELVPRARRAQPDHEPLPRGAQAGSCVGR